MEEAVILHSIDDAKHCMHNRMNANKILWSTNASVGVYLKEKYGLECHCLSEFLFSNELICMMDKSSQIVDKVLAQLDQRISHSINQQLDVKISYFVPLYSYIAKHHLMVYMSFHKAISRACNQLNISKIYIYHCKCNYFLDIKTDISYLIKVLFPKLKSEVVIYQLGKYRQFQIRSRFKRYRRYLRPLTAIKYLRDKIMVRNSFKNKQKGKANIFISEPLYEIEFLPDELKEFNVFFFANNKSLGSNNRKLSLSLKDDDFICYQEDIYGRLLNKDIKEDFLSNIDNYLKPVTQIKELNQRNSISLGIWGNPPIQKAPALIYEYLRSENVPVIGVQHGGSYADSVYRWHFDSDFNRCNYYISYGFTEDDLNRTYPNTRVTTKILPLGKIKLPRPAKKKLHKVDVLFPITNNVSMLNGGMSRIPPHELTGRQINLLNYLNSLKGNKVLVKPMVGSNYDNCSVLPLLKRLDNILIIDHLMLSEVLENYEIRAVLIEFPSTPLLEVISLDVEIFLLNEPVVPFENQALDELQRRVHYSENTNDLLSKLDLFLRGKFKPKRDTTYIDHYVRKINTKENVVQLVQSLVNI